LRERAHDTAQFMNKKRRANIPLKTTWAILGVVFFSFLAVLPARAQEIQPGDFTLSFNCDVLSITENTRLLYFANATTSEEFAVDFSVDEGCGSKIGAGLGDGNTNNYVEIIDSYYPQFSIDSDYKITKCGDMFTFYFDDRPVSYDWTELQYFNNTIAIEQQDPCIENLNILNYCVENEPIATSTSCYLPDNQDIGIITGTVERQENGATTTELWTFRVPAILYTYIFSILVMITTIIIAWLLFRK